MIIGTNENAADGQRKQDGATTSQSLYALFRGQWDPAMPFVEAPEGARWSYGDLERLSARISLRLQAAGLKVGDRLVSQLDRSAWNLFLYLGCLRAGIAYVPLSPQMTAAEAAPILGDAEPAALVCAPRLLAVCEELVQGKPTQIFTLDENGGGTLTDCDPVGKGMPDAPVGPDDIAAIVFTSGTTGRPKGVVLPHGHLAGKARTLAQTLGYSRNDKLLHTMPLYHAHGLFMTTHCVLASGASILLLPRFDVDAVIARLPDVTLFSGVATMYKRMLGHPDLRAQASGMRAFIAGSAPLPAEVFTAFAQESGHEIVECWGMSETMTNTANPLAGPRKPGSAGKPLPGVEIRVVDEAGEPCAPGRPGVLSVRAPTRFHGYWRRPEAEQPKYRDGFFLTGDIGYFDEDGYLFIVGRTGDVIISGGYNVYPREVELALEQIDGVQKAAVFGLPHPDYGEAVAAAIETAQPALRPDDVIAQLKRRLASYKAPKALFVVDSLPLTELGKIQRRVLAERFREHFVSAVDASAASG